MDEHFLKLVEKYRPWHNHIVLNGTETVRLIGMIEGEWDFYFVYSRPSERRSVSSCVLAPFELKGVLDDAVYEQIEDQFAHNGSPKTEEFSVESDIQAPPLDVTLKIGG